MAALNFLLYFCIILPVSLLPFFVLYRLSDLLFWLFYYVLRYRRKVVENNIRHSFPQKEKSEQQEIVRNFYRHFCDLFVESLKLFTISKKSVLSRLHVVNPALADKYFANGKSVILVGGHYNNWELLAVAIDAQLKHHCVALYKPLTNKFFDIRMRRTRGKFGLEMLSIRETGNFFENRKAELNAVIFGSDQAPGNPRKAYWMKFLNQDTAVLFGTEKYARDYNLPVLYGRINKVSRGHYTFELELITDDPKSMKYGAITEAHTMLLEKDINRHPQYWLWSHRRWKHKKPPAEEILSVQV